MKITLKTVEELMNLPNCIIHPNGELTWKGYGIGIRTDEKFDMLGKTFDSSTNRIRQSTGVEESVYNDQSFYYINHKGFYDFQIESIVE